MATDSLRAGKQRRIPWGLVAASASFGLLAACASVTDGLPAYVESCNPFDSPSRQCIRGVPPAARHLGDEPVAVRVDAQCRWNRTGVLLRPGERYDLSAVIVEPWVDSRPPEADLRTGWRGFPGAILGPIASSLARYRWAPMYALIGAEGQNPGSFFIAGGKGSHTAKSENELLLFANDWPSRYGNNSGCLELTIRRSQ